MKIEMSKEEAPQFEELKEYVRKKANAAIYVRDVKMEIPENADPNILRADQKRVIKLAETVESFSRMLVSAEIIIK